MKHTHVRTDFPTAALAALAALAAPALARTAAQILAAGRRLGAALTLGFAALLLTACGSGHGSSSSIAVTTGAPLPTTELSSIEVGPPNATVPVGLVHQFTATGIYSDGSKLDLSTSVVWTSSIAATATISNVASSTGLVTTHSPGTTTITATLGTMNGTTTLTVSGATLTAIVVTPANASLAIGGHLQFLATGIYSDKTTQDLTNAVTWSSGTPAAATIGTTGIAAGIAAGSSLITASLGTITGGTPLSVSGITLVALAITPATPTLAKGLKRQFAAIAYFSDNSFQNVTALATWSSSDSTTATVGNTAGTSGLATTLKTGTVTLSVTYGGMTNSTLVTVSNATLVTFAVTPTNGSLAQGTTRNFFATGTYTDGSTQDLTTTAVWTSSNTAAATISNAANFDGVATAGAVGATTITATLGAPGAAGTITGSTRLTVSAATLVTLGVTPANASVAKGSQVQYTATGIFTDNSTQDLTRSVTWESSTNAATISNVAATQSTPGSQGLATATTAAASASSATLISATLAAVPGIGGAPGTPALTGSTNLNVTAATLVSVAINTATTTVAKGTSAIFTASGTYSDGTTQDLTNKVLWTSSATTVATISNAAPTNGLATGVGTGATAITANVPAALGNVTVPGLTLTVTAATLNTITVTAPNGATTLPKGATLQLTALGTYSDGSTQNLTNSATWTTSDANLVAITDNPNVIPPGTTGVVTGGNPGTATLTASYAGAPGAATVTGTLPLNATAAVVASIVVTPANASVLTGASRQFTATGTYTDGTSQNITTDVTWSSVPHATTTPVASISNAAATQTGASTQGLATGVAVGSTMIVATDPATQVAGSTTLTVTHTEYAYATNFGYTPNDNSVSQYTVGTNGALAPMTTPTVGTSTAANDGNNPFAIAVDPTGHYAYTANYYYQSNSPTRSTVSQFTISPTDGSLALIVNTAAPTGTVAAGVQPNGITVDPKGRAVYVANYGDGTVSQYTLDADGSLTPMTHASVPSDSGAATVTVDAAGKYAYVTNFNAGNIAQFTIAANGSLSPMPTALVNDVANGGPNALVIDRTGQNVYVANLYTGNIVRYSINPADGSLGNMTTTPTGLGTANTYPRSIAINPNDTTLYVANGGDDSVSEFTIGSGGALTLLGTTATGAGTGPNSITIDPSGAYAYVADRGTRNPYTPGTTVSQYTIGADGSLTPVTSPTVLSGRAPSSVAVIN